MNIKEIAYKLMALRESMSAFILTGKLRESIGFDGYGEALARRWIVPDQEGSGMVQVSNHLGTVAEIRQLAEDYIKEEECTFCHKSGDECKCKKCPDCKKANCTCDSACESRIDEKVMSYTTFTKGNEKYHYNDRGEYVKGEAKKEDRDRSSPVASNEPKKAKSESAHFIATSHAFRPKLMLNEIATMGLGNPDRLGTQPSAMAASQPLEPTQQPTVATPAHKEPVNIGSSVRVVQDGKTYVGRISAVKSDGKFSISFGADKPAVQRDYDKTEVTPVADAVTK